MSLRLLPLDDRPVNLDLPRQLAAVVGETLDCPPDAWLGRFLTPGDADRLADWLVREAAGARLLIVSLDMLACGGLVASRTPGIPAPAALRRLEALREVRRRHPALRIYAFSVIMRLTITGADPATRATGRDIFRYSVLRDRVERLGESDQAGELAEVSARIPPAVLEAYLAARRRNHTINRAALDLLADGVLDYLALVQEDTAPAGLHVAEQQALKQRADAGIAPDRWQLYAGTDEAGQTLLARALLQEAGLAFPVRTAFRDDAAAAEPALFEDVPLRETVRRHVRAVGGRPGSGVTLAAHTFTPPQPDLFEMPPLPAPTWEAALAAFPDRRAEAWLAGLPALRAVADLAYCNGGDPHLLAALLARDTPEQLYGYAAWNTAGNTVGTTLAHAALRTLARARGTDAAMERAHREALLTRLLDDGLYQPLVRAWVGARAQDAGASPLNLADWTPRAEQQVEATMQALWCSLRHSYPLAAALDRPFRATLPWGRLFEVRIRYPDGAAGEKRV